MYLVAHQVRCDPPVYPPNRALSFKSSTVLACPQPFHPRLGKTGLDQALADFLISWAAKGWGKDCISFRKGNSPQDGFTQLTAVHPGVQSNEVTHKFNSRAVRQMGHLIIGQNLADHPFAAMAIRDLVSRLDEAVDP